MPSTTSENFPENLEIRSCKCQASCLPPSLSGACAHQHTVVQKPHSMATLWWGMATLWWGMASGREATNCMHHAARGYNNNFAVTARGQTSCDALQLLLKCKQCQESLNVKKLLSTSAKWQVACVLPLTLKQLTLSAYADSHCAFLEHLALAKDSDWYVDDEIYNRDDIDIDVQNAIYTCMYVYIHIYAHAYWRKPLCWYPQITMELQIPNLRSILLVLFLKIPTIVFLWKDTHLYSFHFQNACMCLCVRVCAPKAAAVGDCTG